MFNQNSDYIQLSAVTPIVQDAKETFRLKFGSIIKDMEELAIKKTVELDAETGLLNSSLTNAREADDKELRLILQTFYHQKKEVLQLLT
jgi:hypothetical protein